MKRIVALFILFVSVLVVAQPASAVGLTGYKTFRNGCTLTLHAWNQYATDGSALSGFSAKDTTGNRLCANVRINAIRIMPSSGFDLVTFKDTNGDSRYENFSTSNTSDVWAYGKFRWGRVDVAVKGTGNCYRYDLRSGDKKVYFVDSRPCGW